MAHIGTKQETSMTRTSAFAIIMLAAISATSLTPTGASAHFSGGGGSVAGGFSGSAGHSFGPISASGGYAHLPSGIARSSVISRMPTGSTIARSSVISRMPIASAEAGGHSVPTISKIAELPKMPTPPNPIQDPNHNNTNSGSKGPVGGVVPVVVPVGVVGGEVASATVIDSQPRQAVQPTQNICNCLTKQYLDDGSVLFQDICSKEAALVTPSELKLQMIRAARLGQH
jgi:hypothetical protein